jgi:uncharacterized protein YcbX
MGEQIFGHLKQIYRYPVKSMAGEQLKQVAVAAYGLYGDRSHAFVDETLEGWDSYFTARDIPELYHYRAMFEGEAERNELPRLCITGPDGRRFGWDDNLLQEIQGYSARKMSLLRHQPTGAELLAVDEAGILLVTDRSLKKLEALLGKPVDPRRFRANLIVTLDESAELDDTGWIGKRIAIGTAQLAITEGCQRCMMVTIDPDTLQCDASILRAVHDQMGLNFGVYASVVMTGGICEGDAVRLIG